MKAPPVIEISADTDAVPVCSAAVTSGAAALGTSERVKSAEAAAFIPSRLFGYSLCKKLDGIAGPGTTAWWGERVAKGYGFCDERLLPYGSVRSEVEVPRLVISVEALRDGRRHRIFAYQRLFTINDVKRVFMRSICKIPLFPLLCFDMFEGIYEAPNGYVAVPTPGQKRINRHCVAVGGYDDNQQVIHFLNSWGPNWGNKGAGHLPYEYFKRGLVTESWGWFPKELWKPLRSLKESLVFRDNANERVRAVVVRFRHPLGVDRCCG